MKAFLNFIQEILMMKKEEKIFVGLSQFRYAKQPVLESKKTQPLKKSEIKISDLMRRSY